MASFCKTVQWAAGWGVELPHFLPLLSPACPTAPLSTPLSPVPFSQGLTLSELPTTATARANKSLRFCPFLGLFCLNRLALETRESSKNQLNALLRLSRWANEILGGKGLRGRSHLQIFFLKRHRLLGVELRGVSPDPMALGKGGTSVWGCFSLAA